MKNKQINQDIIDQIGELAEQLDSSLFMARNAPAMPPHIHLKGLSGTVEDVRNELAKLYKKLGGDEELNLQA